MKRMLLCAAIAVGLITAARADDGWYIISNRNTCVPIWSSSLTPDGKRMYNPDDVAAMMEDGGYVVDYTVRDPNFVTFGATKDGKGTHMIFARTYRICLGVAKIYSRDDPPAAAN